MILKFVPLSVVAICLFQLFAAAQIPVEDRVAFTVIEAPWIVILDSKNFNIKDQQVKDEGKSAYFLLSNKKDNLTVSLFIEPVTKCKTSVECRDFVLKTGNPEWGKVQNLVKSNIGEVSYFEFYRPTVQNQPVQMLDMYAEFVENGYWVDLHISKVLYRKEDHQLFETYVKSIKFVSKTAPPTADSDKSIAVAQKTTEDWMLLWDSGEYAESYKELSSYSKKTFDDKKWFAYWTIARKPFGKLKSRKILQIQQIKSLSGIPDRSGAVLRYLSSFENKQDVFETFSLILEKEGVWRLASYNTNE